MYNVTSVKHDNKDDALGPQLLITRGKLNLLNKGMQHFLYMRSLEESCRASACCTSLYLVFRLYHHQAIQSK
ncbi:hypothetical protein BDA96_06G227200 [Sorghum bicolor]|uniref:Uncharacterized protein n=1 Tax=Sorghum bicolor TaxID=4558 RepID=A0A921UD65_SORBI|nr:hypothetical protein BDA96_06G227200 [Sorghum bicolor]